MNPSDFSANTEGGICTLVWDMPRRPLAVMRHEALAQLEALMAAALNDPAVKGIVITLALPGSLSPDLELHGLDDLCGPAGAAPQPEVLDRIMAQHAALRRIERAGTEAQGHGGKPVACALPGAALGLGYELALCCHRIFAAPAPDARIGLPDIKLGLPPGAGGATRLRCRLGRAAAPFLLEGRLLPPRQALEAGLIDEIAGDPLAAARDWVLRAAPDDLVGPWDREGFAPRGGGPDMRDRSAIGVSPAVEALLGAARESAQLPVDAALRVEAQWAAMALREPSVAASLRTLGARRQALDSGAGRPEGAAPQTVRKLGVLGTWRMGAGLALAAAQSGIAVVLLGRSAAAAASGLAEAAASLDGAIARGTASAAQRQAVLARITATGDLDALAGCDMLLEAVTEDIEIKAEITRTALRHVPESCVFATCSARLPVAKLAEASLMPENFIGLHLLAPVETVQLIEVVKAARSGPRALAKGMDFARMIHKTPIVVNDARLFYANRCLLPYINEGLRMLREGIDPALIESAAALAGMSAGPLQQIDDTSIDRGLQLAQASRAAMGEGYRDGGATEVLQRMAALGRLGCSAGAGFYAYGGAGRAGLWAGLAAEWPVAAEQPELIEVQHRLLFVQAFEAVRALERHVLPGVLEGDVGATLGWGFAPWTGGPFAWLDLLGAGRAAELAADLAARHGPRFACPEMLLDMARRGTGFCTG